MLSMLELTMKGVYSFQSANGNHALLHSMTVNETTELVCFVVSFVVVCCCR